MSILNIMDEKVISECNFNIDIKNMHICVNQINDG
jgi:hypothetical protein